MAKLSGFLSKLNGSIGQVTFCRMNGVTVAKEKMSPKETPNRSYEQMLVRMRNWSNLVNLWAQYTNHLHPSFQSRPGNMSDFNMWMQMNVGHTPQVYLPKSMANQGGCVVAPYTVSQGSLPAIAMYLGEGDVVSTDISLGSLSAITETTTVKQFSDAVIGNNPDFANGDLISCFIYWQSQNSETGVPYVSIYPEQIQLDTSDSTTKVRDLVDDMGFDVLEGMLAAGGVIDGGITWLHSRKGNGKTLVSSQRIFTTNDLLAQFTGSEAFKKAALSYGYNESREYLTPDSETDLEPIAA